MKVETDLRAGNLLADATQEADQIMSRVSEFVASAGQQAEGFTSTTTDKATSLWNCLSNTFS